MSNSFVIRGLVAKRAELAGVIADPEKRAGQARTNLAQIDATLGLFDPSIKPTAIRAKSLTKGRSDYFAAGEMSKRCRDALRIAAGEPISAEDIVRRVMADKVLDPDDNRLRTDLIRRFLGLLHRMHIAGIVRKIGHGLGAKWGLAPTAVHDAPMSIGLK